MPEGGLVSTVEDMSHYLIAQLNGGTYQGARLLSEESMEAMHHPDTPGAPEGEGYGMGWIIEPWRDTRLVHHGGSLENFRAFAWMLPEHDYGFIVLINQNGFIPAMLAYSEIPEGVASLLLGRDPETGLSMRVLYGIAAAVFLITMLIDLRWWFEIIRRKKKPSGSKAGRIATAAGGFLRAGALYALPTLMMTAMDRGFSWTLGWAMAPTVILFIAWNVGMGASKGAMRSWMLVRGND
jgi:hypothetical protein